MTISKRQLDWEVFFIWINIGIWTIVFWIWVIYGITKIVNWLK